jgi:hypothetical protein
MPRSGEWIISASTSRCLWTWTWDAVAANLVLKSLLINLLYSLLIFINLLYFFSIFIISYLCDVVLSAKMVCAHWPRVTDAAETAWTTAHVRARDSSDILFCRRQKRYKRMARWGGAPCAEKLSRNWIASLRSQ